MPLTNYEKQVRHRAKVKAKLARLERYEAALREIQALEVRDVHDGYEQDGSFIWAEYIRGDDVAAIIRNALNAEAEA